SEASGKLKAERRTTTAATAITVQAKGGKSLCLFIGVV
ncbi:MAG: hypothetical protein QOC61_749, partial [Acidobacteriota bacterium]|nr:hypothetical protein [Acidobacteriota bacterium]